MTAAGEAKSSSGSILDGFSYLGYKFSGSAVTVRKRSVQNIETSIARAFTRYKNDGNLQQLQDRLNLIVTGCVYGGVSYGWLNYFRQMNDIALLKRLDVTMETMKRRHKNTCDPKSQALRSGILVDQISVREGSELYTQL
ncbi:hypothetical protein [Nonomuraea salmonea]|uniref:hypothetical protein n=1 Tax=Nonomuraea salmonea TaxID=46181 RepID=UPI002FEAEBCB